MQLLLLRRLWEARPTDSGPRSPRPTESQAHWVLTPADICFSLHDPVLELWCTPLSYLFILWEYIHTRHKAFLLVLSLCQIPEDSSERTYLCWLMILRFQSIALSSIDPGSVVRKITRPGSGRMRQKLLASWWQDTENAHACACRCPLPTFTASRPATSGMAPPTQCRLSPLVETFWKCLQLHHFTNLSI